MDEGSLRVVMSKRTITWLLEDNSKVAFSFQKFKIRESDGMMRRISVVKIAKCSIDLKRQ